MSETEPRSRWIQLLRERALCEPEVPVYTEVGRTPWRTLGVAELDRRARAIASELQRIGARGERAMIVHPAGPELAAAVFGCLYAGAAALLVPPPIPDRSLARIGRLAAQAQVASVLTTNRMPEELLVALSSTPSLRDATWLHADRIPDAAGDAWQDGAAGDADPAIVWATPFVAGDPGLASLTHGDLFERLAAIERRTEIAPGGRAVSFLPPHLDMGLVAGVLQPVFSRLHVALIPTLEFLRRPTRWLETISEFRASVSGGPAFAYDLSLRAFERAPLPIDLSSWKLALVDAHERALDASRFARVLEPLGFHESAFRFCEATPTSPGSSFGCHGEPTSRELALVDARTTCAAGPSETAEIWLATGCVGEAYWGGRRRPALTWPAYRGDTGEGPFLATGQLARIEGGELGLRGAAPGLVRLPDGGFDPGALEGFVRDAEPDLPIGALVAFGIERDGEERLVLAGELVPTAPESALGRVAEAVQQRVEEFCGARAHDLLLLAPGEMPSAADIAQTRARTRRRYLDGTLTRTRPSTSTP